MKMKLKGTISILGLVLFCISIFLIGKADLSLCYPERNNPIEILETTDSEHDMQFISDNFSFSSPENECRVPRQTNVANTSRTSVQAKRNNQVNCPRNGFTLSKSGKSMNSYTTLLFFNSINRFPSGLAETSHHLINLGKLII